MNRFYSERYAGEAEFNNPVRIRRICELAGKGKVILDIGCWDGFLSTLLRENDNEVIGVDISEKAIELSKQRGLDVKRVSFEEDLPFPEGTFDVVVAGEVIEHVFDTDRFLIDIKRVLKEHGCLILTTPNLASLGRRILLLLGISPLVETSLGDNAAGHIRYFTKSSLFSLLEKHGFKVENFFSDVVNFNNRGTMRSIALARVWPSFGASLIVKAKPV